MPFTRDWDGAEYEDENTAYDDFLNNFHLYYDEVFDEFLEKVSRYKFFQWVLRQNSFLEEFSEEYNAVMSHVFENNYVEYKE